MILVFHYKNYTAKKIPPWNLHLRWAWQDSDIVPVGYIIPAWGHRTRRVYHPPRGPATKRLLAD
jgi:hypothetical protein